MNGNEYQELAMRTNDNKNGIRLKAFVNSDGFPSIEPINSGELICGALGLCGEAGEVCEHIKKAVFHGHEFNTEQISKELGDVMWYIALCCNALNISLSDIMQMNINKLKKRYPDGFSVQDSIKRMDLQTEAKNE